VGGGKNEEKLSIYIRFPLPKERKEGASVSDWGEPERGGGGGREGGFSHLERKGEKRGILPFERKKKGLVARKGKGGLVLILFFKGKSRYLLGGGGWAALGVGR